MLAKISVKVNKGKQEWKKNIREKQKCKQKKKQVNKSKQKRTKVKENGKNIERKQM